MFRAAPVRSRAAPAQCPLSPSDLAGSGSVVRGCLRAVQRAEEPRQMGEEGKWGGSERRRAGGQEGDKRAVDWGNGAGYCWRFLLDASTTVPLALSAPQAKPPALNGPPVNHRETWSLLKEERKEKKTQSGQLNDQTLLQWRADILGGRCSS